MPTVRLITPPRLEDDRGWLSETYSARAFADRGLDDVFVQDNHSRSRLASTVRGLHFQTPDAVQAKLVRCPKGAIMDVAVDLRGGSPTYGRHVSAILSGENGAQLYLPAGFAHGFMTLEPDTEVIYKMTALHAPSREGGVRFDDPDLAIDWPIPASGAILSARDAALPLLRDFVSPFAYDGQPLSLTRI